MSLQGNTSANAGHAQPQMAQPTPGDLGQGSGGETKRNSLFSRTSPFIGTARNNQQLTQTAKAVQQWLDDVDQKKIIKVTTIDATQFDLGIGVVAISYPFESSAGKTYMVTYLLLIESTATSVGFNREVRYPGQTQFTPGITVNLPTVVSDLLNENFFKKIASVICSRCAPGFSYLNAGVTVVPKEIDLEKDEGIIAQIAQGGTEAMATVITVTTGDYVREQATAKDMTAGKDLQLQINYSPEEIQSITRQPIRSELAVTLAGRDKIPTDNLNNVWDNQSQHTNIRPYVTTQGFIDVNYYALTDQERFNMAANPALLTQRWQANFVISNIVEHSETWSIDTLLLAIYTALHLADQNNWMLAFSPRHASSAQGRDVGYLPLDLDATTGQQAPVNTKSTEFDDAKFAQYMSMMFKPGIGIQIDIEKTGTMGWIGAIFAGAAVIGSPCYNAIVQSAHRFTDGKFPLNYNGPIIRSENRSTLLGFTPGATNQPTDIRNYWDYLALLTRVGPSAIDKVREFDITTMPNNPEPAQVRVAKAREIVELVVGKTVRYTDVADRYSFAEVFLQTYANAIAAADMRIAPSNQQFMAFGAGRRTTGMDSGFVTGSQAGYFQNTNAFGASNGGFAQMGVGQTWQFGQS